LKFRVLKRKKFYKKFPRCYSPKKIAKLVKLTLEKTKLNFLNEFGKKKRQIFVPQTITDPKKNMEEKSLNMLYNFLFIEIR
jgi:hypothetical protein